MPLMVTIQPWSLITRVNIKQIYSLSAILCRDSNLGPQPRSERNIGEKRKYWRSRPLGYGPAIGGVKFANKCLAGKSYPGQACLKVSLNLSTVLSIIITSNHINNNPSYFFVQLVLCPAFRLSNPISYECDVKTALLWRMLKAPPLISTFLGRAK